MLQTMVERFFECRDSHLEHEVEMLRLMICLWKVHSTDPGHFSRLELVEEKPHLIALGYLSPVTADDHQRLKIAALASSLLERQSIGRYVGLILEDFHCQKSLFHTQERFFHQQDVSFRTDHV